MGMQLRTITALFFTSVAVGCGHPSSQSEPPPDNATINAGLDPTDARIVALVSWLEDRGVTLEYTPAHGDWRVTHPKTPDGYDVTFSIRSFPEWASEEQMRKALDVNLAYMLNAPAHLAMSFAGGRAHQNAKIPKSEEELPKLDGLPITKAVEKLFKEYDPG